jgi:hypothetical protein
MSSNLGWEPEDRNIKPLSDELKYAMRKKFSEPVNYVLDKHDMSYLEGLRDGGIAEAQFLLDAIEKHGRIRVREQF